MDNMSLKNVNYLSLNNHFVVLLESLMSTENKLKRKHGHTETTALSKSKI